MNMRKFKEMERPAQARDVQYSGFGDVHDGAPESRMVTSSVMLTEPPHREEFPGLITLWISDVYECRLSCGQGQDLRTSHPYLRDCEQAVGLVSMGGNRGTSGRVGGEDRISSASGRVDRENVHTAEETAHYSLTQLQNHGQLFWFHFLKLSLPHTASLTLTY